MMMSNSYARNYILSQAQAKIMSQTQGLYPAPLKILDVCINNYVEIELYKKCL